MSRTDVPGLFRGFLEREGLTRTRGIVAISGGPDSVALAAAAVALRQAGVISEIHLAHFNHRLRGAESDTDEALVRELAERWNVPVHTAGADVVAAAQASGRNLEDTARELRYGWLAEIARTTGAHWIATGHTSDDQAETVLHHLLRGTGLAGLSGIAARRPLADGIALVRPLLALRRDALLSSLAEAGVGYRTDSSNNDRRFTRNRLRHELLPLLCGDYNPAVVDVLARLASQASDWQAAIGELAKRWLTEVERPRAAAQLVFDRQRLAELGPFWTREILRLAWQREGWPAGAMTYDDWNRLVELVDGTRPRHDFPAGVRGRAVAHVIQLWRDTG